MSNNLHKVYYIDNVKYELEQLFEYADAVRLTQSQKETVDLLISCDYNQNEAARTKGVTSSTMNIGTKRIKKKIYKYLNENNIEIKEAPHKEVNLYSIAKWYESGVYSAIELSRLFGVSARVIQHYCEKNNIKTPAAKRYNIRYTIDDVRKEFEKDKYILLTNHYNRQTDKLEYICPEGHKGTTTFHYWKHNNQRCQICHEREYGNGNYNLKSAERNKKEWLDKKAYIYFIKMSGFGECFYKIGVTVNPTNRFYDFPYDVEILKLYKTNLYFACHIESWLIDILDDYSYEPKKHFGGHTECFTTKGVESVFSL